MIKIKLWLLFVAFISISSPVYAYIDPGTGSMILQGILASIALALGTLKFWWQRFTTFFSTKNSNASIEDDEELDEFK